MENGLITIKQFSLLEISDMSVFVYVTLTNHKGESLKDLAGSRLLHISI